MAPIGPPASGAPNTAAPNVPVGRPNTTRAGAPPAIKDAIRMTNPIWIFKCSDRGRRGRSRSEAGDRRSEVWGAECRRGEDSPTTGSRTARKILRERARTRRSTNRRASWGRERKRRRRWRKKMEKGKKKKKRKSSLSIGGEEGETRKRGGRPGTIRRARRAIDPLTRIRGCCRLSK